VTIHLDTSVVINVITGPRALQARYEHAVREGHRVVLSAPVMYEWLRGPRVTADLELQRQLHPDDQIVLFGPAEAAVAADLYRRVKRARGREMDIAIAACAIEHRASLWTVNPDDFRDIPGLQLYVAPRRPLA
jgi:predicted nucleic acid-binding protein